MRYEQCDGQTIYPEAVALGAKHKNKIGGRLAFPE